MPPTLAFEFMDALLSEFQSHRASAIGLSLEFHLRAQSIFERFLLIKIFNLSMQFLAACGSGNGGGGRTREELALVASACAATCLGWEFTTPDLVLPEDDDVERRFDPPQEWAPVLLSPSIWEVCKECSSYLAPVDAFSDLLFRMAAVNNASVIFGEGNDRLHQQVGYVSGLWAIVELLLVNWFPPNKPMNAEISLNISRVIQEMVVNFKIAVAGGVEFVSKVCVWGRTLLKGFEHAMYRQSFDCVVRVFGCLSESRTGQPEVVLVQACNVLFQEFVEVSLLRLTRGGAQQGEEEEEEEGEEEYAERLKDVSKLGLLDPFSAMRVLTAFLSQVKHDGTAATTSSSLNSQGKFLVLLLTFLLTPVAPALPCKLIAPGGVKRLRVTPPRQLLEMKGANAAVPTACMNVFQFAHNVGLTSLSEASESCVSALLQFFTRWVAGYLFSGAFAEGFDPHIQNVLNFLVEALQRISHYLSEQFTVNRTSTTATQKVRNQRSEAIDKLTGRLCDVLDALIQIPEAGRWLRASPRWPPLAASFLFECACFHDESLERVSRAIGTIHTAPEEDITAGGDDPVRTQLLHLLMQQLQKQQQQTTGGSEPARESERVKLLVICAGLAQCGSPRAYSLLFPSFFAPLLQSQVQEYCTSQSSCRIVVNSNNNNNNNDNNNNNNNGQAMEVATAKLFRLFQHVGGSLLPHMNVETTQQFIQLFQQLLCAYTQRPSANPLPQQAKEVETLLQVIVTIVCKDFGDEYFSYHQLVPPADVWTFVDQAGLALLESLQPILTETLLQYSGVSTVYFLILETCILCSPDRFSQMHLQSRQTLYAATQFGLTHLQPEVVQSALATIKFVAHFQLKKNDFDSGCEPGLLDCYVALLRLMFFGQLAQGMVPKVANALLPLLLLDRATFTSFLEKNVLGGVPKPGVEAAAMQLLSVVALAVSSRASRYGDFGSLRQTFLQRLHDLLGIARPLLQMR